MTSKRIFTVVNKKWLRVNGVPEGKFTSNIHIDNIKAVYFENKPRRLEVVYDEWYPQCHLMGRQTFRVLQQRKVQIVKLPKDKSIRDAVQECLDLKLTVVREVPIRQK